LTPHTRFSVRTNDVAAKIIDGEAIIINLANGLYYSLAGVGSEIWALIEGGVSLGEMAAILGARYARGHAEVASDLERLAQELLDENLVAIAPADGHPHGDPAALPGAGQAYAPPALQIYRDMAELLALDPPMPGLQVSPHAGAPLRPEV
jgi:hypothetical protein